jgi:hypothetical protein
MGTMDSGRLGSVNALTLGGGDIGGVWGTTERRGRSTPYVWQSTPASRCSTWPPATASSTRRR